jgi:hypothetical protein
MDIALAIFAGMLITITTVLGFEASAKPPQTKTRLWVFRGSFILLGIGMIAVTVIQTNRNSREQTDLQTRLIHISQAVDSYVQNNPSDPKAKQLSQQVNRIAAPNSPTDLRVVAH